MGRGLAVTASPDSYTRQAGAAWSTPLGSWSLITSTGAPATNLTLPFLSTSPGGRTVFDASRDIVTALRAGNGTTFTSAITVNGWFYVGSQLVNNSFYYEADVSRGGTFYTSFNPFSNASSNYVRATVLGSTSVNYDLSVNGSFPVNTWHNFTLCVSAGSAMYWNGTLFGTSTRSPTRLGSPGSVLHVRAFNNLQLGEWTFYSVALDPSEVVQNYNARAAWYGRPFIA